MQLSFEVFLGGQWTPTLTGIVLGDGRLGYTTTCGSGVVRPPAWRQTEESTRQPAFRRVCFDALSVEEKEAAVARLGGQPTF